jgi:L,D-transpeptidase YbiS
MSTTPPTTDPGRSPVRRPALPGSLALAVLLLVGAVLGMHRVRYGVEHAVALALEPTPASGTDSVAYARTASSLGRRLDAQRPRGNYLLVSSTDNTFALMHGADTLRAGLCSTGSYVRLTAGDGRSWLFTTPRGRRTVQEKRVRPVWAKPDWAFIESGLPVPPAGAPERFERGVLGDYALSLGDGYLVHGTPYQRLLGMPVTHGCVRLGDEDLEEVFRSLALGSSVILY